MVFGVLWKGFARETMYPKLQRSKMPSFTRPFLQFFVVFVILGILTNLMSSDVFPLLQKHFSLHGRLLMYISGFVACGFIHIYFNVYHSPEEQGNVLPRFTSGPQVTEVTRLPLCDLSYATDPMPKLLLRHSESLADVPGGPDDSAYQVLHSEVDKWYHLSWGERCLQARMTIHTDDSVVDVERVFQSDTQIHGSKLLLRRLEIGPQTGESELDELSLDSYKAMQRARELDADCTLQLGSFAVLKFTGEYLKSWRLKKEWTPTICCVSRYWELLLSRYWGLLPGQTTKWYIRGFNLQNATLKICTVSESEKLKVFHHSQDSFFGIRCTEYYAWVNFITILFFHVKKKDGEDVLLCEEPRLLRRAPGKELYIYALQSVEAEGGVTMDVQSQPKNVHRTYGISVVQCSRHNPWRTTITMPWIWTFTMIVIAFVIMSIIQYPAPKAISMSHHHDDFHLCSDIINVGNNCEENSMLLNFLDGLVFFVLGLVGAQLFFMVTSTFGQFIEGSRLDNDPGPSTTGIGQDLSSSPNPTSPLLNENELVLKDVETEDQEEEEDNDPSPSRGATAQDLSSSPNRTSPLQDEIELVSKDVNTVNQEEKEGSGLLPGNDSTIALSGSDDDASFNTTLPVLADKELIAKTQSVVSVFDPSSVVLSSSDSTIALSGSKDDISFKSTSPVVANKELIEGTDSDRSGRSKTDQLLLALERALDSPQNIGTMAGTSKTTEMGKLGSDLIQLNDSVWELYSPADGDYDVEIIFFHGLQEGGYEGAHWKTWLSTDGTLIWPRDWLPKRYPKARILSVSYSRASFENGNVIHGTGLFESILIDDIIVRARCGQKPGCPVILVGHSLGGFVIKKILERAAKRKPFTGKVAPKEVNKFRQNVRGVFYYATPNGGSPALQRWAKMLKNPSDTERVLQALVIATPVINQDFPRYRTYAVAETIATKSLGFNGVVVVDEVSVRKGVDNFCKNARSDHFTVCKARMMFDSAVMGTLVAFIKDIVKATEGAEQDIVQVKQEKNKGNKLEK